MLTKIACGGMWNPNRRKACGQEVEEECTRCGGPNDDSYHRSYCCTALPAEEDWNNDLQEIKAKAEEGVANCPIFWLRGLVPAAWTRISNPTTTYAEKSFGEFYMNGGDIFSDGSGGEHTTDPRLRRAGFGYVGVETRDGGFVATAGGYGPVPGIKQTVPRGELWGAIGALKRLHRATRQTCLWVDCQDLVRGWEDGPTSVRVENADLWEIFWEEISNINVEV